MKNGILIGIGIIIGWLICWFIFCPRMNDDYTKNWNASSYKHYDCDDFFNNFKTEVSDNSGKLAGIKIQKNDLAMLVDSCASTGDLFMALVLDDDHNKILLAAGSPKATSSWNSRQGNAPNASDTIWYVMPDGSNSNQKVGYIIEKSNKLLSYDFRTKTESDKFVNKILKTILPSREVSAGSVQGCPKNCPQVIATDLKPH